ncbi:MAG TPA: FkbM family methyltransferase [Nitrospira sp.]
MIRYYCTYFDRNYLTRGLALIESLRRSETSDWSIFVVCMDEMTHVILRQLALPNVRLLPLHAFEEHDRELLAVKPSRSLVEYYWTLTPTVILRILEWHPDIQVLTYVDADLFFFSSPQPLFDELADGSILIHEHRFSPRQHQLATHNGRFNVGLLSFRRDTNGRTALQWWRERCIEWCFTRYEQGKMGDQLYLNDWPERFSGVVVLRHAGGGVGPWNHDQYDIRPSGSGQILIDRQPLIFYHFHSFKMAGPEAGMPVAHAHYPLTRESLLHCFVPYLEAMAEAYRLILPLMPSARWGLEDSLTITPQITFLAQRHLREPLADAAHTHRLIALTPNWDAYCSEQLVASHQEGGQHERITLPSHQPALQSEPQKDERSMNTPSQHDLLMQLYQTDMAAQIRTLYVGGAHRFQEQKLYDHLFPNLEHIYLFEPIPELAEYLRRFELHDPRVKVFPYALSNDNTTRELFLTNNDGESSSLLRLGLHKQIFPHVHEVRAVHVPCRTLDRVIADHHLHDPDLLLLDVQGAEYHILSSLSPRLKRRLLAIYVEASLEEVYTGAKNLDDLKGVLQPEHDFIGFAPLGPTSPTHGNALFFNRLRKDRRRAETPQSIQPGEPLISVIVSSYCAEAFMKECLEDLERQTVIDRMEIIVVDAASPEREGAIVAEFQQRFKNISYVRTPVRIGVYAAWNLAARIARGHYITPFSTNDRLKPDAYELLVKALDQTPEAMLVYGDSYVTNVPHETFERHTRVGTCAWPSYDYNYLLTHCCIGPHPMWRRDLHQSIGYFDESYIALGDQDFWIRAGAKHRLLHIPVVTGLYWQSPDGLSNRPEIAGPEERRLRMQYRPASVAASVHPEQKGTGSFDCSVIIPVWNRCELTRDCIAALATTIKDLSWELIVVDNHSTDETAAFLATLSGDVQVIRNQDNLGFAKACNQGAAAARGQYLVFLNNDTVPLDGWLQALRNEAEEQPDVGVVGSKLLYPDKTIQHAGVVFSRRHRIPFHVYQKFPGDHPAVNQRREYQAVTAACLLIRKDLFHEVGGFDERFLNGFEDIDLCLKVREKGHKIVYQPKSVVIHHESQTPGRKTHDESNARLLLERWKDHWWQTDEDLHHHRDGYKTVVLESNGTLTDAITLLSNHDEAASWKHVADTQASALCKDWEGVRQALGAFEQWPADQSVLLWAASVADAIKESDIATAFRRRIQALNDPAFRELEEIRAALAGGQLSMASTRVDALLKQYPTHAEALLLRAILHMQREQYREAEIAFTTALNQGANRKKCLIGIGMASMGRAYPQGAWQTFLRVLAENPDDAEVIHWLLRAGTAQNRWRELSVQLHNYLARNPSDLSVRFAYAGVLLRADQVDASRQEYDQLRALAPTYEGLVELGQAIATQESVLAMNGSNA